MSVELLIVRPTLGQGGADRVTLTLLHRLDRRRFRPSLALLRRQGALLDGVPGDVEIHDLGGGRLWSGVRPLRRLIERSAPDVVLSTSGGTNLTAALAVPAAGPRLVLSERNSLSGRHAVLKRAALVAAKRALYRRADLLTAVSRGVADELAATLGIDRDRIEVVGNPVVGPELSELGARTVDEPWLDGGTPVVVAAGRLVPAKGFDLLLRAFHRLREQVDCRLIVLGEGPRRRALERLRDRLGLAPHVRMPGFVSNPFPYLRRCDLFVLSSRREGLPGVLIQAMALGAPVVATRCPHGPDEIVTDGRDGLLVAPGDAGALAAAMRRLLVEPPLAEALAAAAPGAVGDRFSVDRAVARWAALLDPGASG